jgi:hypothetical protein
MQNEFKLSNDVGAYEPSLLMTAEQLRAEYGRLNHQINKRHTPMHPYIDTMQLIIQHDAGSEKCAKAFDRMLTKFLASGDERTRFYLDSFELFIRPGTQLERMRQDALAKLPPASAVEPKEP